MSDKDKSKIDAMAGFVRLENKIESFALQTRLIILFFQSILNSIIPDHDAGVFNPPVSPGHNCTSLDTMTTVALGGLRRWDAVYTMHIAEYGYTYENTIAFLPLFPITIGKVADAFYCFSFAGQILSKLNICIILSTVLNLYFFTKAASALYKLGGLVLKDEKIAYIAALLFCINPASVFMTAPYTESLFAFLLFNGLLDLTSGSTIKAAIWFGFGSLTRSNGLVAVGFILYKAVKDLYHHARYRFRNGSILNKMRVCCSLIPTFLPPILLPLSICILPFIAYQLYIYRKFCFSIKSNLPYHVTEYGRLQGYKLPIDVPSSWCSQWLPFSYGYIQRTHWGVGFLRYYELKQIPNFLLAVPMLTLSVFACWRYYKLHPRYWLTLGMVEKYNPHEKGYASRHLLVYVAHLKFLTLFGLCFMHIQVVTRFLASSSPVIYWFVADLISQDAHGRFSQHSRPIEDPANLHYPCKGNILLDQINEFWQQDNKTKLVLVYFMVYFVLGTTAFVNFYPWT